MPIVKKWKFSICRILILCLVFTFPASIAVAAESSPTQTKVPIALQTKAANRMASLSIVTGIGNGDFALNDSITRAELVTVMVRAFGGKDTAVLLTGAPSFPDVPPSEWYSGTIALAKNMVESKGGTLGFPDGTFQPQAKMTPAEAFAMTMKFLGVNPDSTLSWPENYIQGGLQAGVITADDVEFLNVRRDEPATRGIAFYLADRAFSNYKVDGKKNVYQTYANQTPPLLKVDDMPTETYEPNITISGKVLDASELRINTTLVQIGADGSFSYALRLTPGTANNVQIWATDAANNQMVKTFTVKHHYGEPATIDVADLTIPAGESVDLGSVVKDKYGNVIPDAALTVESSLGTYLKGKFTASQKTGAGTATFKVGSAGKEIVKTVKVKVIAAALAKAEADKTPVAIGEKVQLKAMDQYGNVLTDDVTWSQPSSDAILDAKTGIFIGSKSGNYSVTAKKGERSVTGTVAVYGQAAKLTLSIPSSLEEGQSGTVTVKAVDQNGNLVPTYNGTVYVTNTSSGISVSVGEIRNGVASGTIGAIFSGTYSFDVRTNDNTLKSDAQSITVTAKPVPVYVNHAPVWLSSIPDQHYYNSHDPNTLDLSTFVSDPDGDTLIFSLTDAPAGSSISGSTIHILTPNDPRPYPYTVTVSDGSTSTPPMSFLWVIH